MLSCCLGSWPDSPVRAPWGQGKSPWPGKGLLGPWQMLTSVSLGTGGGFFSSFSLPLLPAPSLWYGHWLLVAVKTNV